LTDDRRLADQFRPTRPEDQVKSRAGRVRGSSPKMMSIRGQNLVEAYPIGRAQLSAIRGGPDGGCGSEKYGRPKARRPGAPTAWPMGPLPMMPKKSAFPPMRGPSIQGRATSPASSCLR